MPESACYPQLEANEPGAVYITMITHAYQLCSCGLCWSAVVLLLPGTSALRPSY
jgi:hypothetical protein